jgi:nitrite reductase/ring-hydroxylating ferredoxin subunit
MTDNQISRRAALVCGAGCGVALAAGCTRYGASAPAPAPSGAPLGAAADVPVGGGTVFKDQQVVVTQPEKGTFKAFSAVCTHQGCVVSTVAGGTINCECHGSKFKVADGSVATGPATRPLEPRPIRVTGGNLTLT